MPGNKGLLKNSTALQPQIGLPKILGYGSGLPAANPSLVNYFCATSTSGLYQCQVVSGKAAWMPVTSGSTGGGGGGSIIGSGLSGSLAMWVSNSGLGNSFITQPGLSINVTAGSGSPATSGGTPATSAGIVTIQGGTGGNGSTGATSGSASSGGPVYIQGGTGGAGFTVNPPTPGGPVYIQGGTGGNGSGTIPGSGGSVYILGGIPGLSGTFNNGTAGNVNIYGGMASGNQGFQGGSVFIDAGLGVSENGNVTIGTSNATQISLGNITEFSTGQTISTNTIEILATSEVYVFGGSTGTVELNAGYLDLIANYQFELAGSSGSSISTTNGPILIEGGGSILLTSSSGQGGTQSGVSIVGGLGYSALSGFLGGGTAGGVFIQAGQGGTGANSGYIASSGGPVYIQAGQGGTGGTSGQAIQAGGGTVYVFGGAGGTQLSGHPSSGGAGGNIVIDAGAATGSGTAGTITIGTSNATVVNLANANTNVSILGEFITLGQSGVGFSIQPAGGATVVNGSLQFAQPLAVNYGGTGTSNFQAGAFLVGQGASQITTYSGTANQLLAVGNSGYNVTQISGGSPGQQLTYVSGGLPAWSNFTGGFAPGTILAYGSATAPPGWLNCDGTAYSRTGYAALFAVIGTTYGPGDGSTTFNVPDLRGRVAVGQGTGTGGGSSGTGLISGGSALTNRAMGAWLGEETHLLQSSECGVPAHNHPPQTAGFSFAITSGGVFGSAGGGISYAAVQAQSTTGNNSTANAASGHNTIQPVTTVNYIICATGAGSSTWNASYPTRAQLWADEMIATTSSGLSFGFPAGMNYNLDVFQTNPANGDSFTLGCFLQGGIYSFNVLGHGEADNGKIDWYLDGTKIISGQDWYNGSGLSNVIKTTSGIAVNGNGYHVVQGVINGKNASSTNFFWDLAKVYFEPATDQTNIAPPSQIGHVNDFRLTAYSGIGVPTTDQTLVSNLYLTGKMNTSGIVNNNGAVISLFFQGSWGNYQATSVSQSLAAVTSGTAYDVYCYYSGTGIGLSTTAWSNTTTPPARALQDGQLVQSGSPQFRYMGSFYANGSGTTEDSQRNRLIWNAANQVRRPMAIQASGVSAIYSGSAWTPYIGATYQLSWIAGMPIEVNATALGQVAVGSANTNGYVGIGLNRTNGSDATLMIGGPSALNGLGTLTAQYEGYPGVGYNYFEMLMACQNVTPAITFYGNASLTNQLQCGMTGAVWA